ncbi:hypothetical protein CJF42_20990 [Pseudoalteromonas sp. NBT06-2]|uniref:hypothetical protein n=1 Tax=Pseudoalteromonas sp. NBT06-2 TaxID=2025950 RepID=UPI000BA7AE2F|nr:hypothetical protein [Pseudoalteromonas sp. NBT06-2]PAJ72473.1 hypothetical protein CJF42_20990 [Pseudoalteromonas sp. NBT06-2]
MLVVPSFFKGVTINAKMRLDHELLSSPEPHILKWLGYIITKPMLLNENIRLTMYNEISELVSRYAELPERYYFNSNLPPLNLVICDYKIQEEEPYPVYINL